MTGSWGVYSARPRWHRSPRRAWLVIERAGHEIVQFDGPVLELMTDSRTRIDQRIAGLGPDILAPELDEPRILRRLREDDPTRPIGDALLDQRTVAGHRQPLEERGLLARAGRSVASRRAPSATTRCSRSCGSLRPRMQESALHGAKARDDQVYDRAGRPCPRCGHDDPRARPGRFQPPHLLVPGMPAMTRPKRIGHKGADKIAPGNTLASFDAALAHGVDMIEFDVLPERLDGSGRLLLAHDYLDASRRTPGDARGGARALRPGRLRRRSSSTST